MNDDGKRKLVSVLNRQTAGAPPVWLMRQAGRYLPEYRALRAKAGSFWRMCMDVEMAAEITLQPVRRFGLDAAILFSDILVIPFAMGGEVRFEEGTGPLLTQYRDLAVVEEDPSVWAEKLAPVYETVRRVRAALPQKTALLGFAGAPWTLATYFVEGKGSVDQRAAKLWGYLDPDGFGEFLELLAECVAHHLLRQLAAGADGVQLFDSWAGGLSEWAYDEWVIKPTKRVVAAVRAVRPEAKIIGFPRAATLAGYERYGAETGVDAVSVDTAVPMTWAAKALAPQVVVQGNLDPVVLLAGGAAMEKAVNGILHAMTDVPFIFNLGHGVLPETPPDHVADLVARVRDER